MLRTKAATYAILSVIEIARRQGAGTQGVRAKEIAGLFRLPGAYAAKVMTLLTRANILRSGRGPRGGFQLARSADTIRFLEIIEAVEGLIGIEASLGPLPGLREIQDGLNDVFDRAAQQMRDYLREITVADFLARIPATTWSAMEPAGAGSQPG